MSQFPDLHCFTVTCLMHVLGYSTFVLRCFHSHLMYGSSVLGPVLSVLGPFLFLIFINDLPENIRSTVRLFADDCVLYRNIEYPMDCQILQDDLNRHAQWETDWQMIFNVAKCHSMRVTRHPPDKHIQYDYTLHQQRLEQVQSAKYLGLTITDDLDWGQHISEISAKATKTTGISLVQFGLCT